jgi:hydrogenase maturation factor HypF (carbamoyltransferase family)
MKIFSMCDRCQQEYTDPLDRRFHVQPNACPDCGPQLELWDRSGKCLARRDRALNLAVAAIKAGKIIAIKGLGGFHLTVDACNRGAVMELRQRKHRPAKPFALMYPSLAAVKMDCEVSDLEETLLKSSAAPIVLLHRKIADSEGYLLGVAPHNPYLGVMLPYTPLHHLLLADLELPLVATSGNRSGEPICIDEGEALHRLGAIEHYRHAIAHYRRIYNFQPIAIACDIHPDYRSSEIAQELATNTHIHLIPVQHHYAHSLACMAEHQLTGNALGITWDGTGYGVDRTLWGGEFLQITPTGWQRVAHFRPFRLPGGDKAIKEPRRSALGLLFAIAPQLSMPELAPLQSFTSSELKTITTMLDRGINSPLTSSVGRLFDAIASLTRLQQIASFEGQAALQLEFTLQPDCTAEYYPFHLHTKKQLIVIDWEPMVTAILDDITTGESIAHVGFALSIIDRVEAEKTLQDLRELSSE